MKKIVYFFFLVLMVFIIGGCVDDNPSSNENQNEEVQYLYNDFTYSEKSKFTTLINEVIPFIPNNEYYVEDSEDWILFYTVGNSEEDFKAYQQKLVDAGYTYVSWTLEEGHKYTKENIVIILMSLVENDKNITMVNVSLKESNNENPKPDDYLYNDFTAEEKALFNEYFGFVIPFISNNEYSVEEYTYEYSDYGYTEIGINYYLPLESESLFNEYLNKLTESGFVSDGTEVDDYGDTWYFYVMGEYYIDTAYYLYEGNNVIDVYVYYLVKDSTGGSDNPTTSSIQALLDEAANLGNKETLSGDRSVTGTVKEIQEAYTTQYNNISFILTDGVAEIYVHRAKGDCASTLKVGDTVTVTGIIINWEGIIEFQQPAIYADNNGNNQEPSDYLYNDFTAEEKALFNEYFGFVIPFMENNGYKLEEYTYENEVGLNFYLYGASESEFNAYLTKFNSGYTNDGTDVDDYGDTWYLYSKGEYYIDLSYYNTEEGYVVDVYVYYLVEDSTGGSDNPITSNIQALLAEAANLENKAALQGDRSVTGTVKSIEEPYSSQFGNITFYLTDGVADIYIYRAKGDCASTLKVGDTVTVTGIVKKWYELIEFDCPTMTLVSSGNQSGSDGYLYSDFTQTEKNLFNSYFGFVIPFMENNGYTLEEYTYENEVGLNFYLYGASESEFNVYLTKFNSGYTNDGTEVDDYGDTWYFYSKGEYYIDLSYYNTEEGYVVDVYVYYQEESSNTGGSGSADYSDVITNDGKGLPNESDGVYDVDFTKADIKNVTELGYYIDGCPTTGDVKVLVIPVEFSDRLAASLGYSLDKLNKAFNGSGNDTNYRSVSEFYFESSYGKLDLEFVVLDEWFKPSNTSSYYSKQTMDYYGSKVFIGDQLIMDEALAYLESRMDLSEFDSDGNSIIDAVVMINTLEIDDSTDFNWAYRYWNIYTDSSDYYFEYDGVSANDYLWASYQFLFESGDSFDDKNAMNTYTFIHEFGHVLGAEDYYDYTEKNSPLDSRDIMDYMNGDHNPFTKFNYGWLTTSRLVVASDTITLTISEFTTTGDTIIIANNWDDKLGAFQEYYVLMYYKHTGLNEDGEYFPQEGIVMYHVNASLYSEAYDNEDYYYIYNSNTDASDEYGTVDNLIELCKSSTNSYVHTVGSSSDTSLVDDLGNTISYTFTVDSLTSETATLTFTKNN